MNWMRLWCLVTMKCFWESFFSHVTTGACLPLMWVSLPQSRLGGGFPKQVLDASFFGATTATYSQTPPKGGWQAYLLGQACSCFIIIDSASLLNCQCQIDVRCKIDTKYKIYLSPNKNQNSAVLLSFSFTTKSASSGQPSNLQTMFLINLAENCFLTWHIPQPFFLPWPSQSRTQSACSSPFPTPAPVQPASRTWWSCPPEAPQLPQRLALDGLSQTY